MWHVSNVLAGRLLDSHQIITRFTFISRSNEIIQLTTPVVGGTIQVDRTAAQRRRCSFTAVAVRDPFDNRFGDLVPATSDDFLAPFGSTVMIERSVRGHESEWIPLGTFRIISASVEDSAEGLSIACEAADLSTPISRYKLVYAYAPAAGTNYVTAIQTLLNSRAPAGVSWTYNVVDTTYTTPTGMVFDVGDDPWDAASKMAAAIGYEVFFDREGVINIVPVFDLTSIEEAVPVWEYVEGVNCTMTGLKNDLNSDPGYNGVVVSSDTSDTAPIRAAAWDTNPASATYYLGPYGTVPYFEQVEGITSTTQAQDAARGIYSKIAGVTAQLNITAVPNPLLDPDDVIRVQRTRSKIDDVYLIDALDIPLGAGDSQSITCRGKVIT